MFVALFNRCENLPGSAPSTLRDEALTLSIWVHRSVESEKEVGVLSSWVYITRGSDSGNTGAEATLICPRFVGLLSRWWFDGAKCSERLREMRDNNPYEQLCQASAAYFRQGE